MMNVDTPFAPEKWDRGDTAKAVLVGAIVLGFGALAAPDFLAYYNAETQPLTSAHVIINVQEGRGSATHIGGGIYVTAAHVVAKQAEVQIGDQPGVVLWANAAYDIALLSGPDTAETVPLACVIPAVGDVGISYGNPLFLENIEATGRVAGAAQELMHWKLVVPVDGSVASGMSGGGFVMGGRLVGVSVGVVTEPMGLGSSLTGFSVIVPTSVVCDLMGRV